MKQCPSCGGWTLEFDNYFGRYRCFSPRCDWMPTSTAEREIRLLNSGRQPTTLEPVHIRELNLTLVPSYDPENDAFSVDFGLDEATFDLPEPDGRMIWKIGCPSDRVAGFTILGAKKWGLSQIGVGIIARKQNIERELRKVPDAFTLGCATKGLIEAVIVAAIANEEPAAAASQEVETALQKVRSKFDELKV